MSDNNLFNDRFERILRAVRLEKQDRPPVVLEYAAFAAFQTETLMADFLKSPQQNLKAMIDTYHMVGGADAMNYGSFWPYGLAYSFMSKVKVPGVELAPDAVWQVVESELLKSSEYDEILDIGWPDFYNRFMEERLLKDVPSELMPPNYRPVNALEEWKAEQVPVLNAGNITTPIELLSGSRSMMEFAVDLMTMPDKVKAVMDEILPHLAQSVINRAKKAGFPTVWVGGWRAAPFMYSPAMWEKFAWTYYFTLVGEVIDSGLIPILHLDSDWTRELGRFRELPKNKCIMALDGDTDIFKAKELLGDHMCIMGDVSASMLFLDTPDSVYEYCRKLIDELGPEGFILQSGCDIPANAKLENVQAMVQAGLES